MQFYPLIFPKSHKYFVYIMRSLQPHILFGMNIVKTLPDETRRHNTQQSLLEHQELVRAVIDGDGEGARKLMYNHLCNTRSRLFSKC